MINRNIIPPITDPLGQYWQQPRVEDIAVDEKNAVMTRSDFAKLADYSRSIPSGVYSGKMWRCFIPFCDEQHPRGYPHGHHLDYWELRWYGWQDKPGYVLNEQRIILLA